MSKNPCFGCAKAGCGNHANCKEYMDFYAANRKQGEARLQKRNADDFVASAALRIKKRRRVKH